jgi:hypothetical protein
MKCWETGRETSEGVWTSEPAELNGRGRSLSADTRDRSGRPENFYGDSTQSRVCARLDAPPRAARATICIY